MGTSNVYLAMKYNLTPIGTYAHEFVQMYQGIDSIPLAYTNHYALEDWYDEYRGDNGTALTDTVTTDLFLLDFNRAMVNNFTGVRHDSGDPYEWGEKMIKHYEKYGVDPRKPSCCCSATAWTLTGPRRCMTTSRTGRRCPSASAPSAPTIPAKRR